MSCPSSRDSEDGLWKKSAKEFPGVQLSTCSLHRAERGVKAVVAFQSSAFWNVRSKHSSTLKQGQRHSHTPEPKPKARAGRGRLPRGV